jgi:hypothetical protein
MEKQKSFYTKEKIKKARKKLKFSKFEDQAGSSADGLSPVNKSTSESRPQTSQSKHYISGMLSLLWLTSSAKTFSASCVSAEEDNSHDGRSFPPLIAVLTNFFLMANSRSPTYTTCEIGTTN